MEPTSDIGPFVTAVIAAALPAALAVAMMAHMPVTLMTTMAVIVPVITFATLCVAVSMAWAFVVAAKKRPVPHLIGTIGGIVVSMLLMLGLTMVLLRYSPPMG